MSVANTINISSAERLMGSVRPFPLDSWVTGQLCCSTVLQSHSEDHSKSAVVSLSLEDEAQLQEGPRDCTTAGAPTALTQQR